MFKSLAPVAIAGLLLSACDHFGGIDAKQELAGPIDTSCIPRALRLVDGVSSVSYHRTEWPTSPHDVARGASPTTLAETWTYRVGRLSPRVLIYNAGNSVGFNNGIGLTRGGVSDAEIAAYRPVIEQTNEVLSRVCGLDLSGIEMMEIHQNP